MTLNDFYKALPTVERLKVIDDELDSLRFILVSGIQSITMTTSTKNARYFKFIRDGKEATMIIEQSIIFLEKERENILAKLTEMLDQHNRELGNG